jgi:hypothetical protein
MIILIPAYISTGLTNGSISVIGRPKAILGYILVSEIRRCITPIVFRITPDHQVLVLLLQQLG